jgi:hypothetical protein
MAKSIYYYDNHLNNNDLNARVLSGYQELFKGFLLNDSLSVDIKNNWGQQGGFVSDVLRKSTEVGQDILNNIKQVDQLSGGNVGELTGTTESLNAKLVSVSDYYKSFNGTDITYPELVVYYYAITDTSQRDIVSEFSNILRSFVGSFESINQVGGLSGKINAPNNFSMPLTFGETIPGSYTIKTRASVYKNLLCSNVSYSLSPQRTQNNKPLFIIAKFSFINGSIVSLTDLTTNHIK